MRRSPTVLAGSALAAICLAACGTTAASHATTTVKAGAPSTTTSSTDPTTISSSTVPTSTSTVPTTTVPTTTVPTTTVPPGTPWAARTIASVPFTSVQPVLPAGSGAAYLLGQSNTVQSAPEQLTAVNLSDGAVKVGPKVDGGSFLLTYSGLLYVVSPAGFDTKDAPQGPWYLRPVGLGSMTLGRAVSLGELGPNYGAYPTAASFQPSGAEAGDLWAYANGRLELLDPSTGTVLESVTLPASQGDDVVEAEPDGSYVDVAVLTSNPSVAGEVLEFDTTTGDLVATHSGIYAIGTPALAGVPGGVWASFRGGMLGTTVHLAEPSLQDDTPPAGGAPDETKPVPGYSVGMGEGVTDLGGFALITDIFGAGCMSASGTSVITSAPFPGGTWSSTGRGWAPFAESGDTVYAVGEPQVGSGSETIEAVTVPVTC
jgi:hypothetical protein